MTILIAAASLSATASTALDFGPIRKNGLATKDSAPSSLAAWLGFDAVIRALNASFYFAGTHPPSFSQQLHALTTVDHAPNTTADAQSAVLLRGSSPSRELADHEYFSDNSQPQSLQIHPRRRLGCKWVAWKHKVHFFYFSLLKC